MIHLFRKLVVLGVIAACSSAAAQDNAATKFALELNAAKNTEAGSCRLVYVASNETGTALERTAFEVAIFDAEGIVDRVLVLEFGALVAGKTRVLQFDLPEMACDGIGRIVVNDVAACTTAQDGNESGVCMQSLEATTRTSFEFGI